LVSAWCPRSLRRRPAIRIWKRPTFQASSTISARSSSVTTWRDEFQLVLDGIKDKPVKLVEAEALQLGTTHCEIGLCIARKWNFPEAYCEVIAYHHSPSEATIDPVLCAIVNLADLFYSVRELNYGGWVSFNLVEEPSWKILKTRSPSLGQLDVERFCYELDDAIPDVKNLVRSIFNS